MPFDMRGVIFDIKEFAVHDGGGVRTTVFFKGCPMRCLWCHNPEGQSPRPELMEKSGCVRCGRCRIPCAHTDCAPYHRCLHACPKGLLRVAGESWDAEELAKKLARDKALYDMSGGGVTLSGGEVLYQPEFAAELLDRLGAYGIHRAIETAGYASAEIFQTIAVRCDFVYCDLKLADDRLHRAYTGVSNAPILENIAWLRRSGIPYRLRTPLIPGYTDTEENLSAIRAMTKAGEVEYLPYNRLAGAKYRQLGRAYPLERGAENGL